MNRLYAFTSRVGVSSLICISLVLGISGCSSQVTLAVYSEPAGAAVIQNGQVLGYTPTYVVYPKSIFSLGAPSRYGPGISMKGCGQTLPLTIEWYSGVSVTEQVTLCKNVGMSQQVSFRRPEGSGLESDIQVGYSRQRQVQLLERQAALQRERESIEALRTYEALYGSGQSVGIGQQSVAPNPCNCRGYDGPGGPCYSGPGGPAYDGPGGPAYDGPGGTCYSGPGGPMYDGPGGPEYDGPGGPAYDGPGGPAYDGPGGPCYSGPGGPAYDGLGGPCYDGPGGTGKNCPAICKK